ncbi:hypothetical protein ACHAXT_004287 [Thalassiosira profunda]
MGKRKSIDADEASSLADAICQQIRASGHKSMELKALRSAVLGSDAADKPSKKRFKAAVKLLEKNERASLSAEGVVKLSKAERTQGKEEAAGEEGGGEAKSAKKKRKKEMKKKRERRSEVSGEEEEGEGDKNAKESPKDEHSENGNDEAAAAEGEDTGADGGDTEEAANPKDKNKPCKNNPQGITRLFLGNLPFAVTEELLGDHLNGAVTHIKWITDKETGRFYGSAFCEVKTSKDAAHAMMKLNGSQLMGRPIKINYAPMRPGEEGDWPPRSKVITGGKMANAGKGQAGGTGVKAMSAKPEGCLKLFVGNLSYEIDDDGITKFFMGVEAEIKAVRWLHHRDSGDFKGCGFVEFWSTEACEKAATLNGKNLLGRPIRIDWSE